MKATFTGGSLDGRTLDEPGWGLRHIVTIAGGVSIETYIRDRYRYKFGLNGDVIRIAFRLEKTEVMP